MATNNKEMVCPYTMSDGRSFTDYKSKCDKESRLLSGQEQAFQNDYDFRMYLTRNAEKIMEEQRNNALKVYECPPCYSTDVNGTMLPEKNMMQCNEKSCETKQVNENGLGMGRNYNTKK